MRGNITWLVGGIVLGVAANLIAQYLSNNVAAVRRVVQ